MKFWKLLCAVGFFGLLLLLLLGYAMQDPEDRSSNRGANGPRSAPSITTGN
jgi:hypothetical protein